jgi:two-component system OmpR family response regulator
MGASSFCAILLLHLQREGLNMRVLLVEDDPMIGQALALALKDAAYAVDWVRDGVAAMSTISTQSYDLMLLDLGLPRKDGIEVLKHTRLNGLGLPVLILTARDAVSERVQGLDAGADDYLVKPFEISELLARMRALGRRQAGATSTVLTNGTLSLNLSTRVAVFEQTEVRLSAREFALLQALLMRPGAILSRSELEDRIYGWNEEVESNAAEVVIHGIRKKLGATVIKNIRGLGWMVDKCH